MQRSETAVEEGDQIAVNSEVSASIADTNLDSDEDATSESNAQQNISSLPSEQREFELDPKATSFYGITSRIIAFSAVSPRLPKSRVAGEQVTASRPFSMCEKMERKGRIPFAVETPVRIDDHRILLLIAADYKLQPRGIIYDERDGTVSFPEKAVASIIKDMSGNAMFAPILLAEMDLACEKFLQERVLGPTDDTKEGEFVFFLLPV